MAAQPWGLPVEEETHGLEWKTGLYIVFCRYSRLASLNLCFTPREANITTRTQGLEQPRKPVFQKENSRMCLDLRRSRESHSHHRDLCRDPNSAGKSMCLPSACRQESKNCLPRTEGKDVETSLISLTGACVTPSVAAVDEHQESKRDLSLRSACAIITTQQED